MLKKIALLIIGFIVGSLLAGIILANHYPTYDGYVNDFAEVLTQEQEESLETKLKLYEDQTTNEIAVATVKTTSPETIEEYSIHLADQWKPGQVGKDNGILMLFAIDDRKMRNEVGRGLEGTLTDVKSKHVQDDVIRPLFKEGKYYEGIDKGIDNIIVIVFPDSPIATIASQNVGSVGAGSIVLIIIIFLVLLLIFIAVSPYTPLGGEGSWGYSGTWSPSSGSSWGGDSDSDSGSSFGGGSFSGGGSTSSW